MEPWLAWNSLRRAGCRFLYSQRSACQRLQCAGIKGMPHHVSETISYKTVPSKLPKSEIKTETLSLPPPKADTQQATTLAVMSQN